MNDFGSNQERDLYRALAIARDLTMVVGNLEYKVNLQRSEVYDALLEICQLIERATTCRA
jgi:hypothetical protein